MEKTILVAAAFISAIGIYKTANALGSPNPYSSGIMAVGFLVVVAFAYLIFNKVKNKKHGK